MMELDSKNAEQSVTSYVNGKFSGRNTIGDFDDTFYFLFFTYHS